MTGRRRVADAQLPPHDAAAAAPGSRARRTAHDGMPIGASDGSRPGRRDHARAIGQYTSVRVCSGGVPGGLKYSSQIGPAETKPFVRIHRSMSA